MLHTLFIYFIIIFYNYLFSVIFDRRFNPDVFLFLLMFVLFCFFVVFFVFLQRWLAVLHLNRDIRFRFKIFACWHRCEKSEATRTTTHDTNITIPAIPILVADVRLSGALVLERIVRDKVLLLTDNSFRRLTMVFSSSSSVNGDCRHLHGHSFLSELSDDVDTELLNPGDPVVILLLISSEVVLESEGVVEADIENDGITSGKSEICSVVRGCVESNVSNELVIISW